MFNLLRGFRSRMILLLGISMLISGSLTYLIYKLLQFYYRRTVRLEDPLARFRSIMNNIGDLNVFLLIFVPLSILIFFLLTKPYSAYFREISIGINQLANGVFTHRVRISSHDEFRDIAEDINLASEKLRMAVERGDFAENSKDQLVVNLAHDLRTPLTSVLGYLDMVVKDESLTREESHHYSTIAYTKAQRLEKLIDELFAVTRMNYGMLTLDKYTIDISELLIQVNEELYPLSEKNNLTVRVQVDPHLTISGDGAQLARIFENLVTNAIRYGMDGEFVDIKGYLDLDHNEVVAQIINYGDRISPEELPYLFDMFYKGDKARSQQEGTGLGLFIAKNIVEQHEGTITAESNVIRTIFEVRLPYKPAENKLADSL